MKTKKLNFPEGFEYGLVWGNLFLNWLHSPTEIVIPEISWDNNYYWITFRQNWVCRYFHKNKQKNGVYYYSRHFRLPSQNKNKGYHFNFETIHFLLLCLCGTLLFVCVLFSCCRCSKSFVKKVCMRQQKKGERKEVRREWHKIES